MNTIKSEVGLHFALLLWDRKPVIPLLLGAATHASYLRLLRQYPFIPVTADTSILSLGTPIFLVRCRETQFLPPACHDCTPCMPSLETRSSTISICVAAPQLHPKPYISNPGHFSACALPASPVLNRPATCFTQTLPAVLTIVNAGVWIRHYWREDYNLEHQAAFLVVTVLAVPFIIVLSLAANDAVLPGAAGAPPLGPPGETLNWA